MKHFINLLLVLLLAGCASVDRSQHSAGLNLLEGVGLATNSDLAKLNDASTAPSLTQVRSTGGSAIDLAFGSGLVGSTSYLLQTGHWLSPSRFSGGLSLASFALDTLSGSGMKYHKWTYTYFFHISASCDSRDCANATLKAFNDKLNALFIEESKQRQDTTDYLASPYFSPSNFFAKYIEGGATYLEPSSGKMREKHLFRVWDMDELDSYNNEAVWGNETWLKYQDRFNLGFGYQRDTELLIEATKNNPSLVVFRGVDMRSLISKQPCFGGFFIRNGQLINIPELGCMAENNS